MPRAATSEVYRFKRLRALSLASCARWGAAAALAAVVLLVPATARAAAERQADAVLRARLLYNAGNYELAIATAEKAAEDPSSADAARLVLGRAHLERYRQARLAENLQAARIALASVRAAVLPPRERVELLIGLGETLHLLGQHGAAADLFESALPRASELGASMRERVFDWWASSLEREAQGRSPEDRTALNQRILAGSERELRDDADSGPAAYWLAASARGTGDLTRAWSAAIGGWVRAPLTRDQGAALRADLDRLVVEAIIPERARLLASSDAEREQAVADLLAEWTRMKEAWRRE